MRAGWDTSPRKWTEATSDVVTSETPMFLHHLGDPDRSVSFLLFGDARCSLGWPSVKLWLNLRMNVQSTVMISLIEIVLKHYLKAIQRPIKINSGELIGTRHYCMKEDRLRIASELANAAIRRAWFKAQRWTINQYQSPKSHLSYQSQR